MDHAQWYHDCCKNAKWREIVRTHGRCFKKNLSTKLGSLLVLSFLWFVILVAQTSILEALGYWATTQVQQCGLSLMIAFLVKCSIHSRIRCDIYPHDTFHRTYIMNHHPHGVLIRQPYLEWPLYNGANFRKIFNCVNVIRLGICIISRYIECIDTLVTIWLTIYRIQSIDSHDMYQNIFLAIKSPHKITQSSVLLHFY